MDLGLNNRVAVVGGASKGLGFAIAKELAQEGSRVAICSRSREAIEAAAVAIRGETGADVLAIAADLSDPTQAVRLVDGALERWGALDILVTNTGGPPPGRFADLGLAEWHHAHSQLLLSARALIERALPAMRQRGGGRIINITSSTVKQPIVDLTLSNAYRAALVAMAKSLANELGADNILVNNICPGRIATDRLTELDLAAAVKQSRDVDLVRQQAAARIPLGRYGEPSELAALVAFLCSERASYITGATIQCDGGLCAGLL